MTCYQVVGCRDGVAAGGGMRLGPLPLSKRLSFHHHIRPTFIRRVFLVSASLTTASSENPSSLLLPRKHANSVAARTFVHKGSSAETILDERGLIRNPRAARELAFSILYAGFVSDEKPMRIFRQRLKQTLESPPEFSKDLLTKFRYTCDGEDSIFVQDAKTAKVLEHKQCEESLLDATILSAPLTLVYSKSVLRLAQDIIQATEDSWKKHELILTDLLPQKWKESGGAAAVQKCILHMAMGEMINLGTPPKIVINEAVELGKRYSYGGAYRVINGCLWNFIESAYFQEMSKVKVVPNQ